MLWRRRYADELVRASMRPSGITDGMAALPAGAPVVVRRASMRPSGITDGMPAKDSL